MTRDYGVILYEDDSVTIHQAGVEVKWYYFPFGTSKSVSFTEIIGAEEADRGLRYWGYTLGSRIWWAKSVSNSAGGIKLHLKGHTHCVGFSVQKKESTESGAAQIKTVMDIIQQNTEK